MSPKANAPQTNTSGADSPQLRRMPFFTGPIDGEKVIQPSNLCTGGCIVQLCNNPMTERMNNRKTLTTHPR
ncbi:hypothetical protein HRbin20_01518 [bacterium HR20]|nr:hypothetical protein HRbin20_01518 [bacterium HR20]